MRIADPVPHAHIVSDEPPERAFHRYFWPLLLLIVVLAAVVRLYRLSDYPQRVEADEMNYGYEAWSLWSTGADQHGNFLPLHLRGFNEYSLALPVYMSAPFVGLLGLDEFSARLPYALMGIATVYLTALLGRRWFGSGAGLIAGLFLSIDPWHVNFTRLSFLVGAVPLFIVLALYTFSRFVEALTAEDLPPRTLIRRALLSALCFALLTLSYAPMKLEAPLLLIGCVLAAWSPLRQQRRIAFIWLGLYAVFISPLIYDQVAHWSLIQHHFGQISALDQPYWWLLIVRNYAAQYNPSALFFDGLNRPLDYRLASGIGELFWLEGPLWIVAFVALARRPVPVMGLNLPILTGLWIATYPIATSLTLGPISHREINLLPLPELLAGYGAILALEWLAHVRFWGQALSYLAVLAGMFVLLYFCLLFFYSYFPAPYLETNASAASIPYNVGIRPVLQYVNNNAQPCDTIWLEPTYQTYMLYLFYTRYPPSRFQTTPHEESESSDGWILIPSLNNVQFSLSLSETVLPSCVGKQSRMWVVAKSGSVFGAQWQQVISVKNANGAAIWHGQADDK